MAILKKCDNTVVKMQEILHERIRLKNYYPDFDLQKIQIKLRAKPRMGHKSDIYQFDVYESESYKKTICVKKKKREYLLSGHYSRDNTE